MLEKVLWRRYFSAETNVDATYFPLFDWLRLALASAVALYHENVIRWHNAGNFAVQVFFALSGWLIGGILLGSDRHRLPKFYYNRATRIWVPYAIAVAVLYVVAAVREGVDHRFLECLFYDVTFSHNWFIHPPTPMPLGGTGNHFWSIAVEEQFYLAAPLLIVLLPFGRSILFWTAVAALSVLAGSFYGSISLGVLAAVIRVKHGDWQWSRRGVFSLAAATMVLSAGMFVLDRDYQLISPPLALCVVLLTSWQGRQNSVGKFVGGMSYPLYLYHWTGMFVANFVAKHVHIFSTGLVAFVFALAAGAAAYVAVDQNVMRVRTGAYRPILGKTLMTIAYGLLGIGAIGGLAFS